MSEVRFAAQFWPQCTDWPALRGAARAAEEAGWDSIWTWDHLLATQGPSSQAIFEGWVTLGAWAALTSRVQLGLMVGANTLRNPGLTAKLATTLDHVSGGRAVLGIGAAWFEREHEAFGFEFGTGPGERSDRLAEAVELLRRLLDGEVVTYAGRFYSFREAVCSPRPLQAHLPILVGGSGRRKTLRTVARLADAWNTAGTEDQVQANLEALRGHCRTAGRDPEAIERSVSFPIVIRDSRAEAEAVVAELCRHNQVSQLEDVAPLLGPPATIAAALRPFVALGFRTVVARLAAPYDLVTLARIGEVRERLA